MNTVNAISQGLAELLPTLHTAQFAPALIRFINRLVPVTEASVIVYHDNNTPYFDFMIPDARHDQPSLATFVNGAFLLDPYFIAATVENKSGFFRLSELAPGGFKHSEYYQVYYRHSGLIDECGYLIPTQGAGFVNLALGRGGSAHRFAASECRVLADMTPLIEHLGREQWRADQTPQPAGRSVRRSLETALEEFGASVLTRREAQVIRLILHGHTSKTMAATLNISVDTVKLHRKNAYAKLGINMQSELFYLFINSLIKNDHYAGGDPLAAHSDAIGKKH